MFQLFRPWLFVLVIVAGQLLPSAGVEGHPIESGVAITDSDALQELETHGLALSSLLSPDWRRSVKTSVLDNANLAKNPAFRSVRTNFRTEFALYNASYLDRFPEARSSFGIGTAHDHRKFERNWLESSAARFDLVGVVNRMDRAFRSPQTCGEIRLIYRLSYRVQAANLRQVRNARGERDLERAGEITTQSRLPMTVNLVLRARNSPPSGQPVAISCQDLAKRWIAAGTSGQNGRDLARLLLGADGALALVEPSQIDRMETNIQVVRVPATVVAKFGGNAEYLLHIFKWDAGTRTFTRSRLENLVDRLALLKDPEKLAALKRWLFTPEQLHRLVEGTITIPEEFLAIRAITSAPGGTARATNRPFLGLISPAEIGEAFDRLGDAARALDPERRLRSVASTFGFEQRLTDITCTGCHQSRAIGGFHFLGADWKSTIAALPQNSIFISGSPHFYGDLPRRRAVIKAIASGTALKDVDFGRGFSMRPRRTTRGDQVVFEPRFDGLRNGWGANCQTAPPPGAQRDASFADWSCQQGLVCKALHESAVEPGLGICVNKVRLDNASGTGVADPRNPERSGLQIGDPFLFGRLTKRQVPEQGSNAYRYRDDYCAAADILNGRKSLPDQCLSTPGRKGSGDIAAAYQGGGFFGGMHKRKGCTAATGNTVCGSEAGTLFSHCAVDLTTDGNTSFVPCLTLPITSDKSTLRACNVLKPCRDDYVCLATKDSLRTGNGACLPPYFLFQFRIDGHPNPPEGPAEPQ